MKVTKIVQKHFLCPFWGFLVTIICDIKNWRQNVLTSLCQFIYFVNLLHSLCVWFFDIWHLFDNLTSFWHFDISFNLNHLSPSQGYFLIFFDGSSLWATAFRKICHFWADRRIIDLHHEGLTILMQCHLGICRGPFYLPKATFWEFVGLTVFS